VSIHRRVALHNLYLLHQTGKYCIRLGKYNTMQYRPTIDNVVSYMLEVWFEL